MTALEARAPRLLGQPRSRYQIDCAGAQLNVHARHTATILRIDGEIDASNADAVSQAIHRFSRLRAPLILDLSGIDFLGSAGLETLQTVTEEHRRTRILCRVVTGAALRRLTAVVPDHGLPIVDSLPGALERIAAVTRARCRARPPEPQCRAGR